MASVPSQLRPIQRYTLAAFYRDQKMRGRLPCSKDEFLLAVAGEVLSLLPDAKNDPHAALERFERLIDQALQSDRDFELSNLPHVSAFRDLPESNYLKDAIRNAIDALRAPHRTKRKYEGLPEDGRLEADASSDPSAAVIIAETAASVRLAMKRLSDPTDRAIVRLFFFAGGCSTRTQIAEALGLSPSTVGRRLERILDELRESPELRALALHEHQEAGSQPHGEAMIRLHDSTEPRERAP
jgi:RNA polymerase sigma factor (sigma-70 family)